MMQIDVLTHEALSWGSEGKMYCQQPSATSFDIMGLFLTERFLVQLCFHSEGEEVGNSERRERLVWSL